MMLSCMSVRVQQVRQCNVLQVSCRLEVSSIEFLAVGVREVGRPMKRGQRRRGGGGGGNQELVSICPKNGLSPLEAHNEHVLESSSAVKWERPCTYEESVAPQIGDLLPRGSDQVVQHCQLLANAWVNKGNATADHSLHLGIPAFSCHSGWLTVYASDPLRFMHSTACRFKSMSSVRWRRMLIKTLSCGLLQGTNMIQRTDERAETRATFFGFDPSQLRVFGFDW